MDNVERIIIYLGMFISLGVLLVGFFGGIS